MLSTRCVYVVGLILIRNNEFVPLENLPIFLFNESEFFPVMNTRKLEIYFTI
jgi:hypothetical protein